MATPEFIPAAQIEAEYQLFGPAPTLAAPPARHPGADVVVRSAPRDAGTRPGRSLLARGGRDLLDRFDQVLWFEAHRREGRDYDVPTLLAGRAIEGCLKTWLADPFRAAPTARQTALAEKLLEDTPEGEKADVQFTLESWLDIPPPRAKRGKRRSRQATLGTFYNLLLLFQRRDRRRPSLLPADVRAIIRQTFSDDCCEWLLGLDLEKTLSCISTTRNKAAHPNDPLDQERYTQFVDAAVAHESFDGWYARGPRAAPPADDHGVLHHLLAGLTCPCVPDGLPEVLDRLEALPDPLAEPFAGVGIDRDTARYGPTARAAAAADPLAFRRGDAVCYAVSVSRPAWVRVFDCDPDEGVGLLWPNGRDADRQLTPDAPLAFPDPAKYPDPFDLRGTPGEKWLVVCASDRPFEGKVAAPGVRPVAPDDLLALLDSGVATAAVRYTVLP